jgi:hypothetical protein
VAAEESKKDLNRRQQRAKAHPRGCGAGAASSMVAAMSRCGLLVDPSVDRKKRPSAQKNGLADFHDLPDRLSVGQAIKGLVQFFK